MKLFRQFRRTIFKTVTISPPLYTFSTLSCWGWIQSRLPKSPDDTASPITLCVPIESTKMLCDFQKKLDCVLYPTSITSWLPGKSLNFRSLCLTFRSFSNIIVYSIRNRWWFSKSVPESDYRCLNSELVISTPKSIPYLSTPVTARTHPTKYSAKHVN